MRSNKLHEALESMMPHPEHFDRLSYDDAIAYMVLAATQLGFEGDDIEKLAIRMEELMSRSIQVN